MTVQNPSKPASASYLKFYVLVCLALACACGGPAAEIDDVVVPDQPANTPVVELDVDVSPVLSSTKLERLEIDRLALEVRIEGLALGNGQEQLNASVLGLNRAKNKGCLELGSRVSGLGSRVSGLGAWGLSMHEWGLIHTLQGGGQGAVDLSAALPTDPIEVIAQYARELEQRGVDLLVVPIPNRAQVFSDMLPGVIPADDYMGGDITSPRLLLELNHAGVEVLDLYPVFAAARVEAAEAGDTSQFLYLKYNPHWNPLGVQLAAGAISERISQYPWFEQGPDPEYAGYRIDQVRYPSPMKERCNPQAAREEVVHERMLDALGELVDARDRTSPILLLGDSYSAIFGKEGGNLGNCLHRSTGMGIDDIRVQNGGANSVWQTLARRRTNGVDSKKLVIWVFRMRELLPEQGMKKVDLPL